MIKYLRNLKRNYWFKWRSTTKNVPLLTLIGLSFRAMVFSYTLQLFLIVIFSSLLASLISFTYFEIKTVNHADFFKIFFPLFSSSLVLLSLFSNIRHSMNLADKQRNESVRPAIFLSVIDYADDKDNSFDKVSIIPSLEENRICIKIGIENDGLGFAKHLKFFYLPSNKHMQDPSKPLMLAGVIGRIKAGSEGSIVIGVDKNYLDGGLELLSSCVDIFDNHILTKHVLYTLPPDETVRVSVGQNVPIFTKLYRDVDEIHRFFTNPPIK